MSDVHVNAASAEHAGALVALFERADCACFCRYWHFQGTTDDWLDRCTNGRGENERHFREALAEGSDQARGVIALDGAGAAVGWMKLAPAGAVDKIYRQRLYRGLPCFSGDRRDVVAVGCFLVDPSARNLGVARALLDGGIDLARRWGAASIEAFPRAGDLPAEQAWMGPASLFTGAGFEVVQDLGPYAVLRKRLSVE